jgi:sugar phosphate isomerase/epimerase
MNPIGIMQGRLSAAGPRAQMFPAPTWRDEFRHARDLGFDRIEWLIDARSLALNPLLTDADLVWACVSGAGVHVNSICADCFIDVPLVGVSAAELDAATNLLIYVVNQAAAIRAHTVILPLLEGNAVESANACAALLRGLDDVIARAGDAEVRIAIETDLPAAALIEALSRSKAQVCYDLGNAGAAGRDIPAELRVLRDRIAIIHVKDRSRGGASVPLGQGDVPFERVFSTLREIGYDGPLILETPRGDTPIDAAREHLAFVKRFDARPQ